MCERMVLDVMRCLRDISGWLGLSLSLSVGAAVVQVQDQQGQALADAVILVADGVSRSPQPVAAIMDQVNRQFAPQVLVVQVGQAVSFPNSDNIRHHVYSFSDPKPFEIRLYSGVPSAPVIFDRAGVVVLGCNIHDQMVGYILVASGQLPLQSDSDGLINLPDELLRAPMQIWHPRQVSGVEQLSPLSLPAPEQGVVRLSLNVHPPLTPRFDSFKSRFGRE